ncbi:DNA-binding transcriptional LysR family regulator [Rhizomicrobium palustre]|uniref:DNA-binding transcriptional LysR family regulator n=1 Tax=Rhizomicrobium palustre TaxID=189966 RepID=A0A846N1K3_9PROT|nr:LysR family transcriptional regulator [Rhizomicrobium palustre]NIK89000.1 DNA-binding transcriptional LysR family regulator [Rhizomicrobium palustre]
MATLPDFEALAVFAKVAEFQSFVRAAGELKMSKPTVSKAVTRLEQRLGASLFNRTSRKLALTEAGQRLLARASAMLAEGEAAESEALSQSQTPRGLLRIAVPMSFGVMHVAPLLPLFFREYPEVQVDLHLSDDLVDIVGDGFDAAIRIAALPDSSLMAKRLCGMPLYLLAAPAYLKEHGRPKHPMHLSEHKALTYSYQLRQGVWQFKKKNGEVASVRPSGPLRVNNGEAMLPSILGGIGVGILPEFIAREAIAKKEVEILLPEWSLPEGAVYWLTPPGGPKPQRVTAMGDFLAKQLGKKR